MGPRQVDVKWNPVDKANGDVVYDVYFEGLEYVNPGDKMMNRMAILEDICCKCG